MRMMFPARDECYDSIVVLISSTPFPFSLSLGRVLCERCSPRRFGWRSCAAPLPDETSTHCTANVDVSDVLGGLFADFNCQHERSRSAQWTVTPIHGQRQRTPFMACQLFRIQNERERGEIDIDNSCFCTIRHFAVSLSLSVRPVAAAHIPSGFCFSIKYKSKHFLCIKTSAEERSETDRSPQMECPDCRRKAFLTLSAPSSEHNTKKECFK